MFYILTNGTHVIGDGLTAKTCKTCGPTGRARGGFQLGALSDPSGEWEAVLFPTPDSARAYLQNRPAYYQTYYPATLTSLHLDGGPA